MSDSTEKLEYLSTANLSMWSDNEAGSRLDGFIDREIGAPLTAIITKLAGLLGCRIFFFYINFVCFPLPLLSGP